MSSTNRGMTYHEAEGLKSEIDKAGTLEELKEALKQVVDHIYYATREDD